jgi:hypothetical protein
MQQLNLIDAPKLSPSWPPVGLAAHCLDLLLSGAAINHPDFERETKSWRLAAYVNDLRRMGWPIESETEAAGEHRNIARYRLSPEALAELRELIGECPACHHAGPLAGFQAAPMASPHPSDETAPASDPGAVQ